MTSAVDSKTVAEVRRALTELEHMSDEDLAQEIQARVARFNEEVTKAKLALSKAFENISVVLAVGHQKDIFLDHSKNDYRILSKDVEHFKLSPYFEYIPTPILLKITKL